jgi:hypothetical protein
VFGETPMKQNKSNLYRISIFMFFIFLIILSVLFYCNSIRRVNPNEIFIFSAKKYCNDRPVSIFLFARNTSEDRALRNKEISLFINDKSIHSIQTKDDGMATLVLKEYPKDGFTIKACLDELKVEKSIELSPSSKPYRKVKSDLPKIQLQTDKPFYAPGEIINAKIEGIKPLAKVIIKTSITIRAIEKSMFGGGEYIRQESPYITIKTVADSKGKLNFRLKLPVGFGKMDFSKEDSICKISIDRTLPPCKLGMFGTIREEELIKEIIITTRPVRVNCLPEFNDLIPRFKNNIYVFVSDPVKNPLHAVIKSKTKNIKVDKNGLALLELPWKIYTNESFTIDVASQGKIVKTTKLPECYRKIVVKTDKLIYNCSDKIRLDLFSPNNGRMIINVAKDGKSWKFFPLEQKSRKVHSEFNIPEGMFGLIQISAYMIKPWSKRIIGTQTIQVNKAGERNYFSSLGEMIRARFEAPPRFNDTVESIKRNLNVTVCPRYYERKQILRKEKKRYSEILFFSLLLGLFGTFILMLWDFIRIWAKKDCFLVVSDKARKKTRDNIFMAAFGYCFSTFIFWRFLDIIKTERINIIQITTFSYSSIVLIAIYLLILGFIFWSLFYIRKLTLKETENKPENRVRKSIFLLPYLFFVFVFFQHAFLFGLMFLSNMRGFTSLFWFFQMLGLVWFFYVYGIIDFLYTQEEYIYFAGNRTGLGFGLGSYPTSFWKTWILGGILYWGVPIFIYIFIIIIIISLFLPLTRIIECLG